MLQPELQPELQPVIIPLNRPVPDPLHPQFEFIAQPEKPAAIRAATTAIAERIFVFLFLLGTVPVI